MKRLPLITIIIALLLVLFFCVQRWSASQVDVTFVMLVQEKEGSNDIRGLIEGAGSQHFKFKLNDKLWQATQSNHRYEVKATYKNKHKLSSKKKERLEGPFWSNERNYDMLANEVSIQKLTLIK
ncbi:hypothetical protein [Brochothrix campestris]|uniref:Uncharacterized protein n=1 Tax=Brochothrix campestris FSL F6-1037 TaxID=1265861 RepID=W7C504_9LIST|nr:hypothetical protein [Brochothrix campestris]EUJ34524.1 hypothetical protein BCAMP_12175 [Brochothrix campestris FSL F6-1037]